jgi:ubiquitin-protein ligase
MPSSVVYALDFDGVLVDSAGETAQSGLRAAKILWPSALWIPSNDDNIEVFLERFQAVRPVLYVGWESILLVKLILDPNEGSPSNKDILQTFHSDLKEKIMRNNGFGESEYGQAMKEARDTWITQNESQDWIQAHGFFEGACLAVKTYLKNHGNDNIYVITTKAKDFAERLLMQQGLYDSNQDSDEKDQLKESHIFGLGSGPKAKVLQSILDQREHTTIAVMVEDNIHTLDKIMTSPIRDNVLPVVAAWGYNTDEQLQDAKVRNYVLLSENDSSSLASILKDDQVEKLHKYLHSNR